MGTLYTASASEGMDMDMLKTVPGTNVVAAAPWPDVVVDGECVKVHLLLDEVEDVCVADVSAVDDMLADHDVGLERELLSWLLDVGNGIDESADPGGNVPDELADEGPSGAGKSVPVTASDTASVSVTGDGEAEGLPGSMDGEGSCRLGCGDHPDDDDACAGAAWRGL